jgi:SAM-dependent MidA family methyltransferase
MKSRLIDLVGRKGPVPFDVFMEMCLYDPDDGFFASGAVRPGEGGDFVTSPEISPWFGRLLGRWAAEAAPSGEAILVEVGPGSGSLLEPLVDEVGDRFSEVFAVEVSAAARRVMASRVPRATVVRSIADLPKGRPAVVIANEVLDNMPARLVVRTDDGWRETRVGESDGSLSLVAADADSNLSEWCERRLPEARAGSLLAAQQRFEPWMEELASTFGSFVACVVDYGGSTVELSRRDRASVVRSYRSQRSGLDYLAHPGKMDVTLDVYADVLCAAALAVGAQVEQSSQRGFLTDHGALAALTELSDQANVFAASGDVMAQLAARSASVDIGALMDDEGLGGFTVSVISRLVH